MWTLQEAHENDNQTFRGHHSWDCDYSCAVQCRPVWRGGAVILCYGSLTCCSCSSSASRGSGRTRGRCVLRAVEPAGHLGLVYRQLPAPRHKSQVTKAHRSEAASHNSGAASRSRKRQRPGAQLCASAHKPEVTSHKPQVTSHKPQVTSHKSQGTGPHVTSHSPPAGPLTESGGPIVHPTTRSSCSHRCTTSPCRALPSCS